MIVVSEMEGLGVSVHAGNDTVAVWVWKGSGVEVGLRNLSIKMGIGLGEGCQRHSCHVGVGLTALLDVHAAISRSRIAPSQIRAIAAF